MTAKKRSIQPRKRPEQKRAKDKVQLILDTTMEMLKEQNINGMTTNKIAQTAGINVATLYQYFPNKQAIIYAVYQRWLEQVSSGYYEAETKYYLKVERTEFFRQLRLCSDRTRIDPAVETKLDLMMSSNGELAELDRIHSDSYARRMARYLKGYGSRWSQKKLINLALLIYETNWAPTYRYVQQSKREAAQTRIWSMTAYLALIEICFNEN